MSVYLSCNTLKNEISIIIDIDIDTLTECNLYGYNPMHIQELLQYKNIETDELRIRLFNKFLEIISNKNKYIYHLRPNTVNHPQLTEKLYKYKNNFTEYLIKLWTTETKNNIYFAKNDNYEGNDYRLFNLSNQNGGNLSKIKIKINKLPNILKTSNIELGDFIRSLIILNNNKHQIYVKNNYLYIN
jgi:hypothetical protein